MATISVIIPAYNAEQTILETIESLQQQTFTDFEIIVVDDGSTDHTAERLASLADPRLQVISVQNGGVSAARNRGIAQASGEFLAFLDADDLWTADKLELQLAALRANPDCDLAYSWTYFYHSETGDKTPGEARPLEGAVYAELLKGNFLASGSNPLVRRAAVEAIGGFDPDFPHVADWDFYLRLAANGKFALVPHHQILYRQSTSSMTSTKLHQIEQQSLQMLEKTYQTAPAAYQPLKRQSMAWVYRYCADQYLHYGQDRTSLHQVARALLRAIRCYPALLREGYTLSLVKWLLKRWLWKR
jgi:glycosyltransferase involved in cell wall biosynthesis